MHQCPLTVTAPFLSSSEMIYKGHAVPRRGGDVSEDAKASEKEKRQTEGNGYELIQQSICWCSKTVWPDLRFRYLT